MRPSKQSKENYLSTYLKFAVLEKQYSFTFVVEGCGEFPFDMLRYDSCWPRTADDAAKLYSMWRERRRVELSAADGKRWQPTTARWASFGWTVLPPDSTTKMEG